MAKSKGKARAETPPIPVKSQTAQREIGYTTSRTKGYWGVDLDNEEAPELRWPMSLPIYDSMRRQDAQAASVLRAVVHPILRTGWRLDPNGADENVVRHCSLDLGLPVRGWPDEPMPRLRDRFSWNNHLRLALLMLPYGHMYFEQLYRIDEQAGLAHLRKLGPRMPRSISKFNIARDGGLTSIEQYGYDGSTSKITIPVTRLVAYVHDQEGANWTGTSLLRPAYKHWLVKDRLIRVQALSIARNGMGIPLYTGAEGGGSADLEKGEEIATSVRAGDDSGAAIPNTAKLQLLGVEGQIPDALAAIKYHDDQIARAVLAHFLNLGQQTGSWALGSTFADFFTQSLHGIAAYVADVATQHIVEDLVDINYGPEVPAPRVVFDEIGSQSIAVAQAVKLLYDAGVLTPDGALEAFLRNGLGLPAANPDNTAEPGQIGA